MMIDDGERILDLIGIVLVVFILLGIGILIFAAMNRHHNNLQTSPKLTGRSTV
jgi:hypothetical protein